MIARTVPSEGVRVDQREQIFGVFCEDELR